jgi:hypothetical protein
VPTPTPTPLETLLDLAADVMGRDPRALSARAAGSPFIVLGGGLGQALRLQELADERLGLALDLAQLLGPAPLADALARTAPPDPAPDPDPDPGAPGGLWRVLSAELTGPLEPRALRTALRAVGARHRGLRPGGPEVPLLSWRIAPGPDGDAVGAAHARLAEAEQRAGQRGVGEPGSGFPAVCFALARVSPERHVLSFVHREAVADSWSAALVWRELLAEYDRAARRRAPALPGPRASAPGLRPGQLLLGLDRGLRDAAEATARRAGVPHSTVVLAAWALALGRGWGRERVLVGTEVPRRRTAGSGRTVVPGSVVVPVRCVLEGGVDYFLRGVACAFSEGLAGAARDGAGPGPGGHRVTFAARDELLPERVGAGALAARFHHGHLGEPDAQAGLLLLRWRQDPQLALEFAATASARGGAVRLGADLLAALRALALAREHTPVEDLARAVPDAAAWPPPPHA